MIEEIIYTSAAKGLKQGSRGFCTVVSTAGMGANMAERLESMSGYRHAFPLHHPQAALNPVNFAHVTTRMAGQNLHVLSRVADAGQDYSGRTNKLAHHLVVDDVSSLTAGPARVLAAAGTLCTAWDGKIATRTPRQLQDPRLPDSVNFNAWKAATGDGGWGGFVAEKLLSGRAPVSVIFPAGTETLPLVQEVLDLVPVSQRWNITFSTYFTRLLAGTECQLRFYLDGTPEATSIRNDARAIRVDLAASLPPATGGALVDAARSGNLQLQTKDAAAEASRSATAAALAGPAGVISDGELDQMLDSERAADASLARAVRGKAAPAAPTAPHLAPTGIGAARRASRVDAALQRPRTSITAWVVGTLLALVLIGSVATFFALRSSSTANNSIASTQAGLNSEKPSFAPVPGSQLTATKEVSQTAFEKSEFEQPVEAKAAEPAMPDPFPGKRPFDDLRRKSVGDGNALEWILPLPGEKVSDKTAFDDQVFLTRPEKIQITDSDRSLPVKTPLTSGKVTEFAVQHQNLVVGRFIFRSQGAADPVRLTWEWSQDVVKRFGDVQSPEAAVVRKFRNRLFTFEVDSLENEVHHRSDEVQITMRLPELSPFRSWPADTRSNLTHSLNVPEPGSTDANGLPRLKSDTVYIETASLADMRIEVLPEYNAVTRGFNAFVSNGQSGVVEVPNGGQQRTWNIVQAAEGANVDVNNPVQLDELCEPFAMLIATQAPGEEVVALTFEWLPVATSRSQDALPVLWAPLVLTIDEKQRVLFLKGPVSIEKRTMTNLGQNGHEIYPPQMSSQFPFVESPAALTIFDISLKDGDHRMAYEMKVRDRDPLPNRTLAWFELADTLQLHDSALEIQPNTLGIGQLTATAKPSSENSLHTSLSWSISGEFNRLRSKSCDTTIFVNTSSDTTGEKAAFENLDLRDNYYWEPVKDTNTKSFSVAKYNEQLKKLETKISGWTALVPQEQRFEMPNLRRLGDLKSEFDSAAANLRGRSEKVKRLLSDKPEDLDTWFPGNPIQRDLFMKQTEGKRPDVQPLLDAFQKLHDQYSSVNEDLRNTLDPLMDQIAALQIDINIALEIPIEQAGVIRLYIASTSDEVTE